MTLFSNPYFRDLLFVNPVAYRVYRIAQDLKLSDEDTLVYIACCLAEHHYRQHNPVVNVADANLPFPINTFTFQMGQTENATSTIVDHHRDMLERLSRKNIASSTQPQPLSTES